MSLYKSLDQTALLRNFNHAAAHYEEFSALQQEIAQRLFERLEVIKITPQKIVDLGCSTGYCTRELARRYPQAEIIGIDFASGMIESAKENSQTKNITYFCEDAQHTSLAKYSIDLVFSNLLFPFCDSEQLFKECKRLLKPDGLLLFTSLGPDTLQELRYCWAQVDNDLHVYPFIDMHHLGDQLLAEDFSDPVMDMEYLTVTFSDALDLMHSLKAVGEQNAAISRPQYLSGKNKLQTVINHYEQFRDSEGLIPATYEVIYGHAWQTNLAQQRIDEEGKAHIPLQMIKKK